MKKLILLFSCFFIVLLSKSQRSIDLGIGGGVVNYVGDLGNEKQFTYSSANSGFQITLRDFLNNPERSRVLYRPLSLMVKFTWQRLQYDETKPIGAREGSELRNYLRGISFRNDLIGMQTCASYTFYKNKNRSINKQKFVYYVFGGVGVFYGQPKADLFNGDINIDNRYHFWPDGTVRNNPYVDARSQGDIIKKDGIYETDLRNWRTEGQGGSGEVKSSKPYNYMNIGFPMGVGIRYGISKNITLTAEGSFYYFLTDYLDDVSNRYATYDEINAAFAGDPTRQELAKYISDPTGRGTNGYLGPITSRRGNPNKPDSFTYISLELSYKLPLSPKSIFGTIARN
ncbi:MAG: hypothetical protein RIQ89_1211 [Bacteroidota bacterium]|jgi:hypothetical protein